MSGYDLGDGLTLRWADENDIEKIVTFNGWVHSRNPDGTLAPTYMARTRASMDGRHPLIRANHFTLVEDTRTGAIVSTQAYLCQNWTYAGLPIEVGQVEFVGTHPDYRRRGLIRRQMDMMQRLFDERDQLVQVINGIPWFYRQFGYELALGRGGGRKAVLHKLRDVAKQADNTYRVRQAVKADWSFIADLEANSHKRSLLACLRTEAAWQYEFERDEYDVFRRVFRIIEAANGEPVGYYAYAPLWQTPTFWVEHFEIRTDLSWLEIVPVMVADILTLCQEIDGVAEIAFWLGTAHPLFQILPKSLAQALEPGSWYVRVANIEQFLRHIAPVLQARLANSVAREYTGKIALNFFRTGIVMHFERGVLQFVEPWTSPTATDGDARFSGLSFLQLLFGHRSLDELEAALDDCAVVTEEARVLLDILFPKRPSNVWAIG